MKILIDGHMLVSGEGGNERYIENLTLALKDFRGVEMKALVSNLYKQPKKDKKYFIVKQSAVNNVIRILYTLPKLALETRSEIIHATYIGPLFTSAKLVLTVHDFAFKRFPEFFSLRERLIFSYLLPASMNKAAVIIVPSEFIKKEFAHYYPKHIKKVFVTPEAAAKKFKITKKSEAKIQMKKKFGLKSPYLLAFNGKYAKRNINRIIDAFMQIEPDFPNLQLVILGGRQNIQRKIKPSKVKVLKGISDEELVLLYSAAEAVIYFSLYEGFGLPILEAFGCKTPVIVSDIPVHKEVAGTAALYADPYDSNDLAKTMTKLIGSQRMLEKMREKGYKKASRYSWEKTAKETIKAYKFALKNK